MKFLAICILLSFSTIAFSQHYGYKPSNQLIDNYYFALEKGMKFKSVQLGSKDTFRINLNSIIFSTGNPKEEVHFQFTDSLNGFIYGNEMGYGIWPFLFKTSDGGKTWNQKLYAPKQYGPTLTKDNFFMFNKQNGILIANSDNIHISLLNQRKTYFQYYITNDGGETWKKKRVKLKKARGLRIENGAYFMNCQYKTDGQVTVNFLREPWAAAEGKRSIQDRIRLVLQSNDFGKRFTEQFPAE